jgi:hypothetical protein
MSQREAARHFGISRDGVPPPTSEVRLPPDLQDDAVRLVIQQAEALAHGMSQAA